MPEPNADQLLFVVMGGTGDLMERKLLPALYRIIAKGPMAGRCRLLAAARNPNFNDDSYRAWAREQLSAGVAVDDPALDGFLPNVHYQSLGKETPEDWARLADRIRDLEAQFGLPGNRVFDIAIPPAAFPGAIRGLGEAGLNKAPGWTRVVVEKPFGSDLASARELDALLHGYLDESQIYRIDHYLGKETVQNLLAFRFVNPIFESLWNRDRISRVQITVAESVGVDARGGFFDQVGTLRDMVQNHLTQLLALTAMEIPVALDANAIRDEKVKVLRAVLPLAPEDVVYGQYAAGEVGGAAVPGYREESGLPPDSDTETFVALRLGIHNWRWWGVPFYLRTGKRLPRRMSQIVVDFECPALQCLPPFLCTTLCNQLVITIEPDEGFDIRFQVKAPGEEFRLEPQQLRFRYAEAFGTGLREAYETLLLDVMQGNQAFFVRSDEVQASWAIYDAVLKEKVPVHSYPAGSWGPREAEEFLDGGVWYDESAGA